MFVWMFYIYPDTFRTLVMRFGHFLCPNTPFWDQKWVKILIFSNNVRKTLKKWRQFQLNMFVWTFITENQYFDPFLGLKRGIWAQEMAKSYYHCSKYIQMHVKRPQELIKLYLSPLFRFFSDVITKKKLILTPFWDQNGGFGSRKYPNLITNV